MDYWVESALRLDPARRLAGPVLLRALNERLPPRFGYYVGYLVAAEAGKTRSPRRLAALSAEDARPIVEASLRSLADCPA